MSCSLRLSPHCAVGRNFAGSILLCVKSTMRTIAGVWQNQLITPSWPPLFCSLVHANPVESCRRNALAARDAESAELEEV